MGLALLTVGHAFVRRTRLERTLRWLFTMSFAAAVTALVVVSLVHGIHREDVFEVYVIGIVWTTLIIGSPLVAVVIKDDLVVGIG